MNKYFGIVLAAVFGGLIALGGAYYLGLGQQVKILQTSAEPVVQFSNLTTPSGDVVPATGFSAAADKALPAVVHIKAAKRSGGGGQMDMDQIPEMFRDFFGPRGFQQPEGEDGQGPLQQGSGSGVIISADGYIVTNNHVVADAEELEVVLNDQRSYEGTVIGTDPTTDIALIKIEEKSLPTVKFADSDGVRVGEWVVAVGNPFSLTSTVTAGIVSAKGRNIDILRRNSQYAIESFIQTDAVVNPGNSGGALVNINGDLIGINTAISSPTGVFAGYSFAVPSTIVAKVVEDLKDFGVVQRGYLGAQIVEVNADFAERENLERESGVYVSRVSPGSAAEEGGVEDGDVIVAVDDVPTLRNSELLEQLGRRRPGDRVRLTVDRDGKEREITVTLKNQAGNFETVTAETAPALFDRLGAELATITDEGAEELGLDGGVQVVVLRDGLLTDQTRIQRGFVITKIDGKKVEDVNDVERALTNKSGAVALEGIYPGREGTVKYALVF